MQSVPITTTVVSSNPAQARCTHTTLCNKVCQLLGTGRWFSSCTPVSSTNKTDHHDITEILLKVVLNTIDQPPLFSSPLFSKCHQHTKSAQSFDYKCIPISYKLGKYFWMSIYFETNTFDWNVYPVKQWHSNKFMWCLFLAEIVEILQNVKKKTRKQFVSNLNFSAILV
jgi:hypothetical protein